MSTYEYIWTDLSGSIISNDAQIDVEMEGIFMLEVLNTTY